LPPPLFLFTLLCNILPFLSGHSRPFRIVFDLSFLLCQPHSRVLTSERAPFSGRRRSFLLAEHFLNGARCHRAFPFADLFWRQPVRSFFPEALSFSLSRQYALLSPFPTGSLSAVPLLPLKKLRPPGLDVDAFCLPRIRSIFLLEASIPL